MEKEYSIVQCSHCKETKKRFLDGNYPNTKDKKWINEEGLQWNGRTCPICHKEKVAKRKRNKKNTDKAIDRFIKENKDIFK